MSTFIQRVRNLREEVRTELKALERVEKALTVAINDGREKPKPKPAKAKRKPAAIKLTDDTAKKVYEALGTGEAGTSQLARDTELPEETVETALAAMKDQGLVTQEGDLFTLAVAAT